MATKFIATWICIDSKEDGTYFPSSKGYSSDLAVQIIYWKCVISFFASAQRYLKDEKLMLFTNTKELPKFEELDLALLLDKIGVSVVYVEFNYKLPKGYYNSWTNQFFEFSILDYIADNYASDDIFLMLDSDCIFLKDLEELFQLCSKKQCITYIIDYPVAEVINGISREQMKDIFGTLLMQKVSEIPSYHAGEFFMATVTAIQKFAAGFHEVWPTLLKLNAEGKPKLIEEAHVLSYLYFINQYAGGEANSYIKRIWTDPTTFRNAESEDTELVIWHVPAEKKFGIERLFQIFKRYGFDLRNMSDLKYHKVIGRELNIPSIPPRRKLFFFAKKTAKLLFGMVRAR